MERELNRNIDRNQGKEILTLGAGVSGLTTGILLLKEGFGVTIWAKDFPPDTTSNKAAAVWYPFIVRPPDRANEWAKASLEVFQEILNDPKSGTEKRKVIEVFTHQKEDPWWRPGVDSFRRTTKDELPAGYQDGYAIEGLIMDTNIYMEYLVEKFKELGGKMIKKNVEDISEPLDNFDTVINCTGLGSRKLFGDNAIYPTRGQTIAVKHNGFDHSIFEEEGPNSLAYIIPRINDIILGGTAQENNWSLEPDPKDAEDILRKCAAIRPEFKNVEILRYTVGLRPARSEVRLELEKVSDKNIVHNYGHGGSGFTLSWGCSQNVLRIVNKLNDDGKIKK